MHKLDVLNRIRQERVIAILRTKQAGGLLAAAQAMQAGGLSVIEVTMTTPNAINLITETKRACGDDVLFGAGSVLDPETARQVILAGADFIVTPTLNIATIRMARRYGVVIIMGAYSPTEILTAWEEGADLVKVFPSDIGGAAYLKAVRAPMPQIDLVPTGGITLDSALSFLNVGAFALGVGTSLLSDAILDQPAEITRRARAFQELVSKNKANL